MQTDTSRTGQPPRTQSSDKPAAPNTFRAIDLDPRTTADLPFPEYVEALHDKALAIKIERSGFSEGLRQQHARWANGARALLAVLGSAAFLLTAVAAGMRFFENTTLVPGGDKTVLLIVLGIYAVMGTISFYEKATDRTTTYFRHVAAILAIRDLWTKFQFEFMKELMTHKTAPEP